MPALFYGSTGEKGRHLYTSGLTRVKSSVFDNFRIEGLAPYRRPHAVANIWHMVDRRHTIISWHIASLAHEQTIFLPGLLDQRVALEAARITFDRVVPSPLIFRFRQDYHDVLLYD